MLPEELRSRLASEFRFAADRMAKTSDMATKLYFFSVFYGEPHRLLNLAWDAQVALIYLVAREVYREINQRVTQIAAGQDRVVGLHEDIPTELTKAGDDLAKIFEAEKVDDIQLLQILGKMSTLSYLSTGNGKYLALKGAIEIR